MMNKYAKLEPKWMPKGPFGSPLESLWEHFGPQNRSEDPCETYNLIKLGFMKTIKLR